MREARVLPHERPIAFEAARGKIATEGTAALRPKYGRMYGFEEATLPNAEMVAWAMFEYR